MMKLNLVIGCLLAVSCYATPYSAFTGLTDFDLRQMLGRIGNNLADYEDLSNRRYNNPSLSGNLPQELMPELSADYSELALPPSLRDREYLTHSSVLSNGPYFKELPNSHTPLMNMGGKPSPDTKPDGVLPAYCNPPNPCPLGYTEKDGCIENYENTAEFSRDFQALQECMCDTEHMFQCPDSNRNSAITALARSIQNEGAFAATFDKIQDELRNPYFEGEKLPIAAKKGMDWP